MTMDVSCRFAKGLEEIVEQSLTDDFRCLYCEDYVCKDELEFKCHIQRVHFNFSYCFMLENKTMWVLACRRKCISSGKQGNRSHFHCPVCGRTYGRKPGITHHINRWKGECVPREFDLMPEKHILSITDIRSTVNDREESLPYSFETIQAARLLNKQLGRNSIANSVNGNLKITDDDKDNSSYTVVVEKEMEQDEGGATASGRILEIAQKLSQEQLIKESLLQAPKTHKKDNKDPTPGARRPSVESRILVEPRLGFEPQPPDGADDDAATFFGKTVTSRIRGMSRRKQGLAMQKIMQLLFEVEYS